MEVMLLNSAKEMFWILITKINPNGDLIDSYIHQSHQRERHIFPDDESPDNIDFDVETYNVQINNIIECNGIPQQIASV